MQYTRPKSRDLKREKCYALGIKVNSYTNIKKINNNMKSYMKHEK